MKTMNKPSMVCTLPTSLATQAETVLPRRMDAISYNELQCNHCDAIGTLEIRWHVDDELCNGACPKCKRNDVVAVFADTY